MNVLFFFCGRKITPHNIDLPPSLSGCPRVIMRNKNGSVFLCQEETDMGEFRSAVPYGARNFPESIISFWDSIQRSKTGKDDEIVVAIAARSYYRLYINGKIRACGPARTAKHYCRVDRHIFRLSGRVHIAIETAAYDKPEKYCNDCTLEPGCWQRRLWTKREISLRRQDKKVSCIQN